MLVDGSGAGGGSLDPVVDAKDRHGVSGLVEAVKDPVGPATGAVDTCEFVSESASDALRILNQRAGDEIDDSDADNLG